LFPGRRRFASAAAVLVSALLVAGTAAAEPGIAPSAEESAGSAYAGLLARHVRPGRIGDVDLSVVDYAALRGDPLYAKALADLASTDPEALPGQADRFAFWINAYNLLAIRTVADHWPVAGIRDLGGVFSPIWKKPAGVVGGRTLSLDEIEHGILRPRFRDPRVHFAIVCASVSCPDLRAEPYRGARLSEQLDEAARIFLANPAKGLRLDEGSRTLAVSSIFRWFAEDFAAAGGILAFVRARAEPPLASRLAGFRDADLAWIDYDWSVNDAGRSRLRTGSPGS
jgi:hypothetical protein